jgi:hypothetical protein
MCAQGRRNLRRWKTQVETLHMVSHRQRTETSLTMDSCQLHHTYQQALHGSHDAVKVTMRSQMHEERTSIILQDQIRCAGQPVSVQSGLAEHFSFW